MTLSLVGNQSEAPIRFYCEPTLSLNVGNGARRISPICGVDRLNPGAYCGRSIVGAEPEIEVDQTLVY